MDDAPGSRGKWMRFPSPYNNNGHFVDYIYFFSRVLWLGEAAHHLAHELPPWKVRSHGFQRHTAGHTALWFAVVWHRWEEHEQKRSFRSHVITSRFPWYRFVFVLGRGLRLLRWNQNKFYRKERGKKQEPKIKDEIRKLYVHINSTGVPLTRVMFCYYWCACGNYAVSHAGCRTAVLHG